MQAARILEKSDSENAKKYLTNIYLETGKIYEKRHLHENAL